MKIDNRYSASVWIDRLMYEEDDNYKNYIINHMQTELAKAVIQALFTKGAIAVFKEEPTMREEDSPLDGGVICREDIYIKKLVRCEECKHRGTWSCLANFGADEITIMDGEFCSKGEPYETD